MPNYNQAPSIKYIGNKMSDEKKWGYAKRSHELETAIMCGLGDRDTAMLKIMLFLTGNAEGFQVAEATICERCNISSTGYKNARKKLVTMGWLHMNAKDNTIEVDYNAILGKKVAAKTSTESTSIEKMGSTESTSIEKQGSSELTSMVEKSDQNSSIGVNSVDVYSEGVNSVKKQGSTQNTPKGYSQLPHNNIREQNKINTIKVTADWCRANGYAMDGVTKFRGNDGKIYEVIGPEKKEVKEKWIYDF